VSRLLKLINVLIAVALVVACGCVYWFVWRVLPQTSGTLRLPVSSAATVTRDALGVPHIRAGSLEDAAFLQGYVTAQDRLWQMDASRRSASGELAEVAGSTVLSSDFQARALRLRRIAEEQARTLLAEERAVLSTYARGVNEFLRTHRGALPVEFKLVGTTLSAANGEVGYDPRPWSIVDTLAIGMEMSRRLSQTHQAEIAKAKMMAEGDPEKVKQLFPERTGQDVAIGSNAWVISGAHTASGKPLLANDPHLEFAFPSTWYQVHLEAPGLNVTGVSLPGVPMVIIGHNDRIAWGVTNLHFDVMDLYREKVNGAGQYEFNGRVEQGRVERESIPVKGVAPVGLQFVVTRHGFLTENDLDQTLMLQWSAAVPGFRYVFAELNRARDWNEFRAALAKYPGPAQNFVYADVDGNIGYQATGRLPIRKAECDPTVPLDGVAGQCEWAGFIPFEELPSVYNPPSGRIVSANQNPFPASYKYPVAGRFSPPYRARQIEDLLKAKPKHTAQDMLRIQKDVYSPFHVFLARELARVGAQRGGDERLRQAVTILQGWKGQMEQGQAGPVITQLAYEALRRAVGTRAAPKLGKEYEAEIASAVVERLLRERPKDWFEDYDALLLRSLAEGLEAGTRLHGPRLDGWDHSRQPRMFSLGHPVLARLPGIGQYFTIGPAPMSGAGLTVKPLSLRATGWHGPSMRFVADLGDWERSQNNLTLGQSGQPLSGHFTDQWEAYYVGRSFPMQYRRVTASAVLSIVPE
jgi:penicillin amidase